MVKIRTRTEGQNIGDKYPIEKPPYPYGARARGSGVAQIPQPRSVDSMKAPGSKNYVCPKCGWSHPVKERMAMHMRLTNERAMSRDPIH